MLCSVNNPLTTIRFARKRISYVIIKKTGVVCWSNFSHVIESICIFSTRHITIQPVVDTDAKIVSPRTLFSRMDFLFRLTQIYCFSHEARLRISHHKWLEMNARKRRPPPFSSVRHPVNLLQVVWNYTFESSILELLSVFVACFLFSSRAMTSRNEAGKKCHTQKGFHLGNFSRFSPKAVWGMGRSK